MFTDLTDPAGPVPRCTGPRLPLPRFLSQLAPASKEGLSAEQRRPTRERLKPGTPGSEGLTRRGKRAKEALYGSLDRRHEAVYDAV